MSDVEKQESTDATPLTETELAEMEARCSAATPAPWEHVLPSGRFIAEPDDLGVARPVLTASTYPGQEGIVFCGDADATFIREARTDLPRLLVEVRRLRALLAPKPSRSQCPRGCAGSRLVALTTNEGRYWMGDGCPVCGCTWCFQIGRLAEEIGEGVARTDWHSFKAEARS